MDRIAAGIFAHVDAGKTTLSEGLLFCAGEIHSLGRVDTRNTFLDTDEMERKRGITIFSKQAVIETHGLVITLLDTPGHTDFAAEAERTLGVLDYAILVISGTDGIQSHTRTLWNLLSKYSIPTFIFINKLDLSGADRLWVVDELKNEFNQNFVDFMDDNKENLYENIAVCDEKLMQEYFEKGEISENLLKKAIRKRNIFPCFGGSALKMEGVESFLKAFMKLTEQSATVEDFGAKVFKIGQDERGQRLTFMTITGGTLKVKDVINEQRDTEKINEIRIYSGEKYKNIDSAKCGCVCAVTGPLRTYAGQGLGFEKNSEKLMSEPIFNYSVKLPQGTDASVALSNLKLLQEEETQLDVIWNEQFQEIQIRLMGEIQLEVLKALILKRFDMDVRFEQGRIIYKETIKNKAEGVGHYEPLRHYAEVHLLLEPLERGAGIQFAIDCSEDELDKNWQRLIMTHLMEKTHIGVLTGSPITDIRITLRSGRAHQKHTEGGDFRQATYRAVRHGLRCTESILLEPYYDFVLQIPRENVGKAMTDLDLMGAEFGMPETRGELTKISGKVSADAIKNYQAELVAYTHGMGKLSCKFSGYGTCKNADAVMDQIGYNPDADVENTADSVFCAHGAGFNVKWNEVGEYMHLESILKPKKAAVTLVKAVKTGGSPASDDELLKIFERTYGKLKQKNPNHVMRTPKENLNKTPEYKTKKKTFEKEYLLIDGYNIIFAWEYLKDLAKENLDSARNKLIERLSSYKIFKECEIIIVFDAYKVKGNPGEVEEVDGITVVYTKEAQTADSYIEKTAKILSKNYQVTVATSDSLEQLIIFGSGAFRMPARALLEDVTSVENNVRELISHYNLEAENPEFLRTLRDKFDKLNFEH